MWTSLDEIIKSINSQTNNKSSGNGGLKAVFYKHFPNELAPVLLDVYDSWGKLGTISVTSRIGIISTTYKTGDKRDIENYRPTSFLNLYYKIYTIPKGYLRYKTGFCHKVTLDVYVINFKVLLNCAPTSTQLTSTSTKFFATPSTLLEPKYCNWEIFPNLGGKIQSCLFCLKIGTDHISRMMIFIDISFLNFKS